MDLDRRAFLKGAFAAALSPLIMTSRGVASSAAAAAPAFRPEPTSISSALCARCGSPDHQLLAGVCPQDAPLQATLLTATRRQTASAHQRSSDRIGETV